MYEQMRELYEIWRLSEIRDKYAEMYRELAQELGVDTGE